MNLVYCKITAPITGRVGLRLVDPGNIVHATDTNGLLVITQSRSDQRDLHRCRRRPSGGAAQDWPPANICAPTHGIATTRLKIGSGTLATVDNQIDPTTGSLRLRANFDNKNNLLFPNQFVNVRLLVQQKTGVTLVPTAVIQRNTNSTYVYLVKDDKTVTVRQDRTSEPRKATIPKSHPASSRATYW